MHKYVMQLVLEVEGQEPVVIPLPETTFIAVTSYQNSMVYCHCILPGILFHFSLSSSCGDIMLYLTFSHPSSLS